MRRWLFFAISIFVFLADQATKAWAVRALAFDGDHSIVPGVFYLTRTTNTGGAFGLFPSATWLLAVTALIAVIGITYYAFRVRWPLPWLVGLGLALPLGGAAGNFLDRVRLGHVVDFIGVYIGSYSFPIFNVADSAICVGVALLAISFLRSPSARPRAKEHSATAGE